MKPIPVTRCLASLAMTIMLAGGAPAATESITIGMQLEPPNLDPTGGAAAAIDEVVYANIFEGLTRYAADGTIRPALARSWDVSHDGTIYRFHLQEGVSFHDGSGFDAGDVKFSLDRARAEGSRSAQKALFAGITDVRIIDSHTVEVTLSEPDSDFATKMAWGDAIILDPVSADRASTDPVGTGPFRLQRWVRGDRIEIVQNTDYWGKPALLEKAVFRFIPDPTAAFSAILAGDIDAFPNFPAPETLGQLEGNPRFRIVVGSTEGETILAINNRSEPLDDIRIRKAIAHAIDRQELIDGAMFGYGTPIGTHFAPHHPDYLDLTGQSGHDAELSRKLLTEAGYGNGLTLRLMLPPPSYARRGGEIIASQLRDVGIETDIANLEWAQWLEQVFTNRDYDLTIVSHTEPNDINIYARPDYYFQYDSREFRELMSDLTKETDPVARRILIHDAQQMIADDHVNAFLFQLPKTGVADSRIMGLWGNSPTQANDLTAVYWTE